MNVYFTLITNRSRHSAVERDENLGRDVGFEKSALLHLLPARRAAAIIPLLYFTDAEPNYFKCFPFHLSFCNRTMTRKFSKGSLRKKKCLP